MDFNSTGNSSSEGMILSGIGPYDVLLGRGTGPNNNLGNLWYRELVKSTMAKYAAPRFAGDDADDVTPVVPVIKQHIIKEILDAVHSLGGRFVRKLTKEETKMVLQQNHHHASTGSKKKNSKKNSANKNDNLYIIVSHNMATEKTNQAIRFQLIKKQDRKNSSSSPSSSGSIAEKIIAAKARFERNKNKTTIPHEGGELKVGARDKKVQDAPPQIPSTDSIQHLIGYSTPQGSTASELLAGGSNILSPSTSTSSRTNPPEVLNDTVEVGTRSNPMMITRDPYLGGLPAGPFLLNAKEDLLRRMVVASPGDSTCSARLNASTSSGSGLVVNPAVATNTARVPAPSSLLRIATTQQQEALSTSMQQILQDALILAESEVATAVAALASLQRRRRHHQESVAAVMIAARAASSSSSSPDGYMGLPPFH